MKALQFIHFKISTLLKIVVVTTFFSTLFISCGDDNEDFITANATTFTFNELNTCNIGSGLPATSFDFVIDYEASENIEITKITFDLDWSNGDSESTETTEFNDLGTRIEYDWCYRFGGDDWVEITQRIVTNNDLTSNSSVIRVNRPDGAN